jgi:hypothetical protein
VLTPTPQKTRKADVLVGTVQEFTVMLIQTESVHLSMDRDDIDSLSSSTVWSTVERVAAFNSREMATPIAIFARKYALDNSGEPVDHIVNRHLYKEPTVFSRNPTPNARGVIGYRYKFEPAIDDKRLMTRSVKNELARVFEPLAEASWGTGFFEHVANFGRHDYERTQTWCDWPRTWPSESPVVGQDYDYPASFELVEVALPLECAQYADKHKLIESIALYNAETKESPIIIFARKDRQPGETEFVYRSYAWKESACFVQARYQ